MPTLASSTNQNTHSIHSHPSHQQQYPPSNQQGYPSFSHQQQFTSQAPQQASSSSFSFPSQNGPISHTQPNRSSQPMSRSAMRPSDSSFGSPSLQPNSSLSQQTSGLPSFNSLHSCFCSLLFTFILIQLHCDHFRYSPSILKYDPGTSPFWTARFTVYFGIITRSSTSGIHTLISFKFFSILTLVPYTIPNPHLG